jgi:phosphoglycolate phosphatase-like HAD superfamily hydrolase
MGAVTRITGGVGLLPGRPHESGARWTYVRVGLRRDLADDWTSSADVEKTKPEPDLVRAAMEMAGSSPEESVMVGDSTWDCEAAKRAGVQTLAVLTGGFSEQELRDAGAAAVYGSISELRDSLGETRLG